MDIVGILGFLFVGIGFGQILGNITFYAGHRKWGSKKLAIITTILSFALIGIGILLVSSLFFRLTVLRRKA